MSKSLEVRNVAESCRTAVRTQMFSNTDFLTNGTYVDLSAYMPKSATICRHLKIGMCWHIEMDEKKVSLPLGTRFLFYNLCSMEFLH